MRAVEEVRARILASVPRMSSEAVDLEHALGRVLAEPLIASEDIPPWDNSGMDGYAVHGDDVTSPGAELEVVGDLAAGEVASSAIGSGQALKIMTGAPMPRGSDTVVRVEDTMEVDGVVRVGPAVERGAHVRPRGGDVGRGTEVLAAGSRLAEPHIGMLAALGVIAPLVSRRPRVAVLSTGDELMPPGTSDLPPGRIRDSNRPMLASMIVGAGCEVIDMGSVGDDADALRAMIGRAAAEADVIVSTGGVSMGDYDVVKSVLGAEAGVEFLAVAMSPGKPLGFGMVGGRPFFGLPGNPVSVFVSFEQFARPALLAMQGASALLRPRVTGVAGERFTSDASKEAFLRARVIDHERLVVVGTGGQASNVLSGAARADCFAVLPVGVDSVDTGDSLTLELFGARESRGVGEWTN